jgi:transcriptional repressor NrdR
LKRSGASEAFMRVKILSGVSMACQWLPVTEDQLALHAQRVEAYRASHGRLPRTKQEVGIASDEISYDRPDSLSFELTASIDGQPVSYKSSQPRDRYLAEAMTALTRAHR